MSTRQSLAMKRYRRHAEDIRGIWGIGNGVLNVIFGLKAIGYAIAKAMCINNRIGNNATVISAGSYSRDVGIVTNDNTIKLTVLIQKICIKTENDCPSKGAVRLPLKNRKFRPKYLV